MFDVNSLGGKLIDNQELKKLIEQGGGGSSSESPFDLVVTVSATRSSTTYTNIVVDKSNEEIVSAIQGGLLVVAKMAITVGSNTSTYFAIVNGVIGNPKYGTVANIENTRITNRGTAIDFVTDKITWDGATSAWKGTYTSTTLSNAS